MTGQTHAAVLNEDEEDEIRVFGYSRSLPRKLLFGFLVFLTGGTLLLLTNWKPRLRLTLMSRRSQLRDADCILVIVSLVSLLEMLALAHVASGRTRTETHPCKRCPDGQIACTSST